MEDKVLIDSLPEKIKSHLSSVTKSSGLPDNEESFTKIAQNWIEKEKMFQEQIQTLGMIEVDNLSKDDPKGALMLSYSGSLISIAPLVTKTRWAEYASIKLRSDVPDLLVIDETLLANDAKIDQGLELTDSPIKATSALYKIAVCKDDVSLEEQEKRIREATIFLTNGFMKLNRTLMIDQEVPDRFTMKSIVNYIAKKNNLTNKKSKQIIEDYLYMIESGMLLNERVSLGRVGKMFLKVRPAQKARVIKNPATGEDMTVNAKPEMYVPKISFSKAIKEKAENVKITGDDDQDNRE